MTRTSVLRRLVLFLAIILIVGVCGWFFIRPLLQVSTEISWTPASLRVTALAGTTTSTTLKLANKTALPRVSLEFSQSLQDMMSLPPGTPTTIDAAAQYNLPIHVAIPADKPAGNYNGELSVGADGKNISHIAVQLTVTAPSATTVPQDTSVPIGARIGTWHENAVANDELVVGLAQEVANPDNRMKEIAAQTHAVIMGSLPGTNMYQLRYPTANINDLETIRTQLGGLAHVSFASHHPLSPAASAVPQKDPLFHPWDQNKQNWGFKYIKAPSAWDITTGSSKTRIGFIDTGFDLDHEDLRHQVVAQYGQGNLDAYHGTETSGIACAEGDNGVGITGVMWHCGLGAYTFASTSDLRQGSPHSLLSALDAASLMKRAASENMRVVNMSAQWIDNNNCQAPHTAQTLLEAQEYNHIFEGSIDWAKRNGKDVLWVFAAGNECRNVLFSSPASLAVAHPENVVAVAATDEDGKLAKFSDFGQGIAVAAPGDNIYTAYNADCTSKESCRSNYTTTEGTSLAAPFVAGVAGLVLTNHPDFSAQQVLTCIVTAANMYGQQVAGHDFHILSAPEAVRCDGHHCEFGGSLPTTCGSTKPDVMLQRTNTGNSSSCKFSVHIDWGDGHTDDRSWQGDPTSGVFPYITHNYSAPGQYRISTASNTTSFLCSISSPSYLFNFMSP